METNRTIFSTDLINCQITEIRISVINTAKNPKLEVLEPEAPSARGP